MTHPSPERIVVRIPGKLFIAGEYAVVTPGQPAVLAAVDLAVTVTLDAAAPARVVTSTGYKTLTWTPASPGIDVSDEEHGLDYVVAALTVMEDLRRERSIPDGVFALDIDSGLDDGTGRKFGLGSSAAVTVGVVRAVGGHLGLALTPDEEYRLAMLATLSVSPDASGGDVAASTHGGWIFYRSPDREVLAAAGALGWLVCEMTRPLGLRTVTARTRRPPARRPGGPRRQRCRGLRRRAPPSASSAPSSIVSACRLMFKRTCTTNTDWSMVVFTTSKPVSGAKVISRSCGYWLG